MIRPFRRLAAGQPVSACNGDAPLSPICVLPGRATGSPGSRLALDHRWRSFRRMGRRMCRSSSRIGSSVPGVFQMARSDGGNCTRRHVDASCFPYCICKNYRLNLSDVCREDEALRELVANWHRLTPSVREAIVALVREAGVSGDGLEARGIRP